MDRRLLRIPVVGPLRFLIGMTETRIKIAQYLFRRRGVTVVLVARFVAVLRSIAGFVAGASRMSVARFMVANGAGAVAWALIDGLAGLYLGKGFEKFARPAAMALAVIVAIAIAGVFLYWRRKEQGGTDNPSDFSHVTLV